MSFSSVRSSLLLAAYFRGNKLEDDRWTSCTDQVLTLSLFYTGYITTDECLKRFSIRRYVGGLYTKGGRLVGPIRTRYRALITLIGEQPHLIEGGGNLERPADPTFTACRLTDEGLRLIPEIIGLFPRKPDFPNWPDRRTFPSS